MHLKKGGKWMSLCCTVGGQGMSLCCIEGRSQLGHCLMDGIKFEFNDIDIISLYTKNDSGRRRYVSLGYFKL